MKDPYSILGVSPSATDDEIKTAYRNLARKYHPDNYGDDNPLKDLANEKMAEVNAAYEEIQRMREAGKSGGSSGGTSYRDYGGSRSGYGSTSGVYYEIRCAITSKRFGEAERLVANVPEQDRTAEWHYLNSVLLMRRGYANDAMRELETACSMDPQNMEYQEAKRMFNNGTRGYGSTYYGSGGYSRRSAEEDACNCCTNLICLDCLCEMCGGDLIRCI